MGKRELLILSLFVAAGVIAWRFTAPPAPAREARSGWTALLDAFRSGGSRSRATASKTTRGTIGLTTAITEVRVSNVARIQAIGGTGSEIEYELTVDAMGASDGAAREVAERTTLAEDRVGSVLALRLDAPRGARTSARLTLRVPSRIALRTDSAPGTGRLEVSGVASVRLESVVGDVRIANVAGDVTGSHRNGELSISETGAAQLSLASSNAELRGIRGALTATARNGRLHVLKGLGPIELDVTNQRTTIAEAAGTLHVLGSGGTLQIASPAAAVTVDVRRMAVDVALSRAVPVSVLTADAPLRLDLIGPPPIVLDASTSDGGRVRIASLPISVETTGAEMRATHTFGSGAATVALRNRRGDIVIDASK